MDFYRAPAHIVYNSSWRDANTRSSAPQTDVIAYGATVANKMNLQWGKCMYVGIYYDDHVVDNPKTAWSPHTIRSSSGLFKLRLLLNTIFPTLPSRSTFWYCTVQFCHHLSIAPRLECFFFLLFLFLWFKMIENELEPSLGVEFIPLFVCIYVRVIEV